MEVPLRRLLYLYYVGNFFNTFLPSGFGGDAIKMYELARYSRRGSESVGTVLVDRLTGIIVLFVMGLMVWPFVYRDLPGNFSTVLLAVSGGGLLASWLLFQRRLADPILRIIPGKVGAKVAELYSAIHTAGTKALWRALAASAVFNIVLFTLNYFVALALHVHLPFIYFIAFMPILSLSLLIPSVGALGTRESAYVLVFGTANVAQPLAIAMSLTYYFVNVLTGLIGIVMYAIEALTGLRTHKDAAKEN